MLINIIDKASNFPNSIMDPKAAMLTLCLIGRLIGHDAVVGWFLGHWAFSMPPILAKERIPLLP